MRIAVVGTGISGLVGVCQMVLTKPGCRRAPILGPIGASDQAEEYATIGGAPCAAS